MMHKITSLDNSQVKQAASLKKRKYRQDLDMFLIEGRRAVMEAKRRPELINWIFVEEQLMEDYDLLQDFETTKIFATDHRVMRHICSTEHPQGIALVMRNPHWDWQQMLVRKGIMLLLDRVSDPGNMGSILRSAWALGIDGIMLGRECVDHFSPKVVRASMGAILNIPIFASITAQHLDQVQQHGYVFMATDLAKGLAYDRAALTAPLVLIFGNEAEGVSEELKQRCQSFIKIPMNPQVDSLNVAAACAIIIAEIARQSRLRT